MQVSPAWSAQDLLASLDEEVENWAIHVLRSPVRSPMANAHCERLIGTIRRECLDYIIPLSSDHLRRILREWVRRYNTGRPHRSLGSGIPDGIHRNEPTSSSTSGFRPHHASLASRLLLLTDELDIPLLPKSGYQRIPQGTQGEVLTPGKNQKRYLAGVWDGRTGLFHHCCGLRKSNELFRNVLEILARRYPAGHYECVYVVVNNYKIHNAPSRPTLVSHAAAVPFVLAPDLLSAIQPN